MPPLISAEELNPHSYPTTPEQAANLAVLLGRINKIRAAWDHPMVVTSGLRSMEDQMRINSHAPRSKHLMGQACDVSDPEGKLKAWVRANLALIEDIGFWMEDFSVTPGWVHFQIVPPASGNRFFFP